MDEWVLNTSNSRIKEKIKWKKANKERKLTTLRGKKKSRKLWLVNIRSSYYYWGRHYKLDWTSWSKDLNKIYTKILTFKSGFLNVKLEKSEIVMLLGWKKM